MDVDEATAFIRQSLLDNYFKHLCSSNDSCSEVHSNSRTRRSLDLDYNGGLDVIFLVDVSDGVTKDDYKIGLKFAQELIRVLAATVMWVMSIASSIVYRLHVEKQACVFFFFFNDKFRPEIS